MNNFGISDSIEWRAIRLLAIITVLYIATFMLKMGRPSDLWWWLGAIVFFAFLYSPFLLLLKFSQANREKPTELRIVLVTMLLNSVGGFFLSYEAYTIAKTDTGGVFFFAVLPMFQLAISSIGIAIAKGRAK